MKSCNSLQPKYLWNLVRQPYRSNKGVKAMRQRRERTVLFLCTGNYYRSRFAEILFNSGAASMGLRWRACSRGLLALKGDMSKIGPMDISAIKVLEAKGVRAVQDCARFPEQIEVEDLENASLIIGLKEEEHRPLLRKSFPAWSEKIEYWDIDDTSAALDLIEHAVMDLLARLLGEDQP